MAAPGFEDMTPDGEDAEDTFTPYYPHAGVFVHEWLIPTFRVQFNRNTHWCTQWWEHPEGRTVLTAMWQSWEHSRLEPRRMASWFRDVGYPLFDRLTGPVSPFRDCDYGYQGASPHHKTVGATIRQLPMDPIPDGLFDDVHHDTPTI